LCSKIFKRSYLEMRERVKMMDNGDEVSGSTNFISFLENDNNSWIKEINDYLESSFED